MKKSLASLLTFIAILALAAMACNLPGAPASTQGTANIGGTVSADLNGNGTFDEGEESLEQVIVSLSGCGEAKTALSAADGSFQFSEIPSR
jgi:hypothetical protein